jgi:hypothetical protein
MRLNRASYAALADEDIAWLKAQPRTLEREHVIGVVEASKKFLYLDAEPLTDDEALAASTHVLKDLFPRQEVDVLLAKIRDGFPGLWREMRKDLGRAAWRAVAVRISYLLTPRPHP